MANGFSHVMDVELLKRPDANCESGLIADISLTFFWHFDQTFLKRGYEKPAQLQIFAFITSNAVNNNAVLQGEQTNTQPGNNAWPSLSRTSVLFTVWSVSVNSAWPLPPDFNIHVSLFNSCMDTEMSAVWYNVHLWCCTSLFLLSAFFFFFLHFNEQDFSYLLWHVAHILAWILINIGKPISQTADFAPIYCSYLYS